MMATPTFYQDIKPLFTQYDRIMMMFYTDFWNYEDVKARADPIYLSLQPAQKGANPGGWSKLPEVHVMPVGTGPWTQSQIDLFGAWVDDGCPEGIAPPSPPGPSPNLPLFITLSKVLTGFADLAILKNVDTLAQIYMDRLLASAKYQGDFSHLMSALNTTNVQTVIDGDGQISADFQAYDTVIQAITMLWYSATLDGKYGGPQNSQYVQGLEWRAYQTHPMGFANENIPFYWQYEPTNTQYTGLIPWVK